MANARAILLMTLAMAFFAASDAFIKHATAEISVGQCIALVSVGNLLAFVPMLWREGGRVLDRSAIEFPVVLRTIGETAGSVGVVMALATIPLATASAILQAQPLAVTLAAAVFLGEAVGWRRWSAIAVGFLGVLVILKPGGTGFDPNMLWAILGIAGLTVRDIGTRMLPERISSNFAIVWSVVGLLFLGIVLTQFSGGWSPMRGAVWASVAGAALTVTLAFWVITAALRMGEVSAVVPFRYTRMAFALVIAFVFFGEIPDAFMWIGLALIIGSGAYSFWRERRVQTAPPEQVCEG